MKNKPKQLKASDIIDFLVEKVNEQVELLEDSGCSVLVKEHRNQLDKSLIGILDKPAWFKEEHQSDKNCVHLKYCDDLLLEAFLYVNKVADMLNEGWEPDWTDDYEKKWFIEHLYENYDTAYTYNTNVPLLFVRSEEVAKAMIRSERLRPYLDKLYDQN